MPEFKKIKKSIEKAKSITILPSSDFQKDSFPASLALFYSLKKLGKNVNIAAESYPKKFEFLVKGELRRPKADFLISIKADKASLSSVFYEKTEDRLNFYLKSKGGELKKRNISFQPLNKAETVIAVGLETPKKIKETFGKKPEFLINIGNQGKNERYGQVNLIEETASLSEIVFGIIETINKNLIKGKTANSLLWGVTQENLNIQNPKMSFQTLQKVKFLIRQGADLEQIALQIYGNTKDAPLQLFWRALAKIDFLEAKKIIYLKLIKSDFSQTNSLPLNLKFSFAKLASSLSPFQGLLSLWEDLTSPFGIRGFFYSLNKKSTQKISRALKGAQKGNSVLFSGRKQDIGKIKEIISETL